MIYLAGSEGFLPNTVAVLQERKSLCTSLGFDAFSPFNSKIPIDRERNL
ncbi:nucleoside 2-deoxyribosyltransferase [Leptospira weilii]|nr:nucleoside 2-deoxyribosyltransferase [Leptospira weilii]